MFEDDMDDVDEFGDEDDEFIDLEIDVDKMMKEEEVQKGSTISAIKDQLSKVKEQESDINLVNDITLEVMSKEQRYGKFNSKNGKKNQMESNAETLVDADEPVCICQRCFRLQQYGKVEESLRPGWSDHELLTPDRFQSLLSVIKDSKAVVLCIIDIFDLKGSLLANLKSIAGPNPIVIAANKVDLLPTDASIGRLTNWIHAEVKDYCGLLSPRDTHENSRYREKDNDEAGILRRSNVHLVSCQSGYGIESLMRSITGMAAEHGGVIYVMGAANVGKSSFINRLLDTTYNNGGPKGKQAKRSNVPQATVSNLPGTTLDFLKIRLPNGLTMIDTPGLINKGQLTAKLTTDELKQVIPRKPINTVTLRVSQGKCILLGGLARVELLEGLPFFFTFFVSNEIKLHPTASDKAEEFLSKHVGSLVFPPASYERLEQLGILTYLLTHLLTHSLAYLLIYLFKDRFNPTSLTSKARAGGRAL
jgi:ribosome biogenesis GTPase A